MAYSETNINISVIEKSIVNCYGWVATQENSNGVLEAMEENQDEIYHAATIWYQRAESMGACQYEEKLLEKIQEPDS